MNRRKDVKELRHQIARQYTTCEKMESGVAWNCAYELLSANTMLLSVPSSMVAFCTRAVPKDCSQTRSKAAQHSPNIMIQHHPNTGTKRPKVAQDLPNMSPRYRSIWARYRQRTLTLGIHQNNGVQRIPNSPPKSNMLLQFAVFSSLIASCLSVVCPHVFVTPCAWHRCKPSTQKNNHRLTRCQPPFE